MDFTTRNKIIKNALCKVYNKKDVTVRGDRGTATGWVKIKVMFDKPEGCTCNIVEEAHMFGDKSTYKYRASLDVNDYRSGYYCPKCKEVHEKQSKIVRNTINNSGAFFTHYTSDDGYNTEHREEITEVEVRT